MSELQTILVFGWGIASFFVWIKAIQESGKKKNPYGLTPQLLPMAIFAWADGTVISIFWIVAAGLSLITNNWWLFGLMFCLFWVVRSLGETIYWFCQQFSTIERNPPKTLKGYKFFKNDAIWFVYQVAWQCVTVLAIVGSLYFAKMWLGGN